MNERFGQQKLAIRAIEHIEETIAIGLDKELSGLAPKIQIEQHRNYVCIPVVEIVRSELLLISYVDEVTPFMVDRDSVKMDAILSYPDRS